MRSASEGDSTIISVAHDGLVYRSKKEAATAAARLLSQSDRALPCYPSARHNWLGSLEKKVTAGRSLAVKASPYLGEAFTASAGWHTLRALANLNDHTARILLPVWGLNHQFASLVLEKKK